ncbi:MAG: FG-GAP repeat protein [Lewinellaceae bacterium]|nr:FG-GAP repeat protein [Phaeodactylibacter sp.]MCB9036345.1 FG-GAP repeat protein [Lewinellaceae bacterium]
MENWGLYQVLVLDVNGDRFKDLVWVNPGSNTSIYVALSKE